MNQLIVRVQNRILEIPQRSLHLFHSPRIVCSNFNGDRLWCHMSISATNRDSRLSYDVLGCSLTTLCSETSDHPALPPPLHTTDILLHFSTRRRGFTTTNMTSRALTAALVTGVRLPIIADIPSFAQKESTANREPMETDAGDWSREHSLNEIPGHAMCPQLRRRES